MRQSHHAMLLFGVATLATTVSSCSKPGSFRQFDSIVTEELIRDGCKHDVPFSFTAEHAHGKREYSAFFKFPPEHPECNAYVKITISRAGKLLDRAEYEKRKKEIKEKDKEKPSDMQWEPSIFPDIGKRAMAGLAIGPGGGGDSIVFTTNDGSFDVKIEQGNRLSEGVEGPVVLCDNIARDICNCYDIKEGN